MSGPYERRTTKKRLLDVGKCVDTLRTNWLLWVAPTVVFTTVGLLYAVTKKDTWQASQALVVRDEAVGEVGFGKQPLGQFDSPEQLKRALETVLQIALNPAVAETALKEVGPKKQTSNPFPSEKDVELFIEDIDVSAPKGTELGASDVLYLSVKGDPKDRAIALNRAVFSAIEGHMTKLRNDRAKSLVSELLKKKEVADASLAEITKEMAAFEKKLGPDLGAMRTLAESVGGEGSIGAQTTQIRDELRNAERKRSQQTQLFLLLRKVAVGKQPNAILTAPNQLLEVAPALKRLKEGLVSAQLETAKLRGNLTKTHPKIKIAEQKERSLKVALIKEARNSIRAVAGDAKVSNNLVKSLKRKLAIVEGKISSLAGKRTAYLNLAASVRQNQEKVKAITASLSEARGQLEAAAASSLITRMGEPTTGTKPIGPGRTMVFAGSCGGGFLLGLSLVYLLAPWQEAMRAGRRSTDGYRRRAEDGANPNDRRGAIPALVDARPMQVQSLPEMVKTLPSANNDEDVSKALDQLSQIAAKQS